MGTAAGGTFQPHSTPVDCVYLVLSPTMYCPYAGPGNWDTSSPDCSRQWGFKASLGIRLLLGLGSEILGPKKRGSFLQLRVTTACGFFSDSLLPRYPSLSLLSDPLFPSLTVFLSCSAGAAPAVNQPAALLLSKFNTLTAQRLCLLPL